MSPPCESSISPIIYALVAILVYFLVLQTEPTRDSVLYPLQCASTSLQSVAAKFSSSLPTTGASTVSARGATATPHSGRKLMSVDDLQGIHVDITPDSLLKNVRDDITALQGTIQTLETQLATKATVEALNGKEREINRRIDSLEEKVNDNHRKAAKIGVDYNLAAYMWGNQNDSPHQIFSHNKVPFLLTDNGADGYTENGNHHADAAQWMTWNMYDKRPVRFKVFLADDALIQDRNKFPERKHMVR